MTFFFSGNASLDTRVRAGYNSLMLPLAYFGSPSQWFIFAIICLVVFGASRLPEVARNLGKSLGILRRAKREFEQELMREQESPRKSIPSSGEHDASPEAEARLAHQQEESKDDSVPQA